MISGLKDDSNKQMNGAKKSTQDLAEKLNNLDGNSAKRQIFWKKTNWKSWK
jgi:hypothetical protein